jgi:hypothetical protein
MVLTLPVSMRGATLKAGVAKVDITPAPGKYMLGSGEALTTGTHDPLYARVLVLEVGEKRLALVTLDLCRVFQAPLVKQLREEAKTRSGISYVLLSASHTHSGPIIPVDEDHPVTGMVAWQLDAVPKIAEAIEEAHRTAVEARLGTGYGVAYIGHNRRRVNPDGTVTMFWSNPTRISTAPVDPTVAVLRVDNLDGKPLAILVNYACHPVVVMGNLKQYSADYPGVMCRIVEQAFGDQPLCLFLQGAGGDIDTYYTGVPMEQDPVKKMEWTGERLGQEAARVAKAIHTEAVPEASLDFAEDLLTFRFRWNAERYLEKFRAETSKSTLELYKFYLPQTKPEQQLPVATVLINKRIAMMGVPGEAFVEFQMNWRDRCPVSDCIFLGYANGFFSYFPTIRAATEGGHGANNVWARIEPGAAERMVDHAVIKVYEMLGRLTDTPAAQKPK